MKYSSFVKKLQIAMNERGESLTVDGDPGPKTRTALLKHDFDVVVESAAQQPVPVPPVQQPAPPQNGVAPKYPSFHKFHPRFEQHLPQPFTHLHPFDVLRSVAGENEIPGSKDNPLIAHFHEHSGNLGSHSDDKNDYADEVPHCASAMNWAADMSGCRKTNNATAASWGKPYGNPRVGDWVEVGDLIHKKTGSQNHITMCNKRFNRKTDSSYEGFGSNQGNSIKTSTYKTSEIQSVQVWEPLPGTVLAPIGILGTKPVPSTGSNGESTT